MKSIKLNKKVGADGILHLDIPVEIIDNYVEIMVIYQPLQPQPATPANKSQLRQRLRQIRAEIVASGEHLLNRDELEKEIASRRGGLY